MDSDNNNPNNPNDKINSHKSLSMLCGGGTAIDNVNNIVRWMDSLSGTNSTDITNINKYIDVLQSILEPSSNNANTMPKSAKDVDTLLDNLKTKLEKNIKTNADSNGKSSMDLSINQFEQNPIHIPIDFNTVIQMYSDFVQKDKMFKLSIDENKDNLSLIPQLSETVHLKTIELKKKSEEFKITMSMLQNNLVKLKQNEFPMYLANRIIWKSNGTDINRNGTGFVPGDELIVKLKIVTNSLTRAESELQNQNKLRANRGEQKEKLKKINKSLSNALPHDDLLQLGPVVDNIHKRLTTIKENLPPDVNIDDQIKEKLTRISNQSVNIFETNVKTDAMFKEAGFVLYDSSKKSFGKDLLYSMGLINGIFDLEFGIQKRITKNTKDKEGNITNNKIYNNYSLVQINELIEQKLSTVDITNYKEIVVEIRDMLKSTRKLLSTENITLLQSFVKGIFTANAAAFVSPRYLPAIKLIIRYIYGIKVGLILKEFETVDKIHLQIMHSINIIDANKKEINVIHDQNPLIKNIYMHTLGPIGTKVNVINIDASITNANKTINDIKSWLKLYLDYEVLAKALENIDDDTILVQLTADIKKLRGDKNILNEKISREPTADNINVQIVKSLEVLRKRLELIENEVRNTYSDMIKDSSDVSNILNNVNNIGDISKFTSLQGGYDVNSSTELMANVGMSSVNKYDLMNKLQKFAIETDLLKKNMFQVYSFATDYVKLNKQLCIYYIYQFIVLKQSLGITTTDIIPNKLISKKDVMYILHNCEIMQDKIKRKSKQRYVKFFTNLHSYTIDRSIHALKFLLPLFSDKEFYIDVYNTHSTFSDDLKTANHISELISKILSKNTTVSP